MTRSAGGESLAHCSAAGRPAFSRGSKSSGANGAAASGIEPASVGAAGGTASAGRGAGAWQSQCRHWHDDSGFGAGAFAPSPQHREPCLTVAQQEPFAPGASQHESFGAAVAGCGMGRGPAGQAHAFAANGALPSAVAAASTTHING